MSPEGLIMKWVFNCIYGAAGAMLLPYWLWKLPRARRYRAGIWERLGHSPRLPAGQKRLWIHCASVGEASVPRRLVARLETLRPEWEIVFSTNTDTGAERLRHLYPGSVVFYMPLDFSFCVEKALERTRPDVVLLVELEVWPGFMEACRARRVPVGIINGRIGERSRRMLGALRRFRSSLWDAVSICCARSPDDAAGFESAGMPAERIHCCGSLKYDALKLEVDSERKRYLARLFNLVSEAPVIVAGSTHEGEEVILASAYRDLKIRHRDLRLIVAPRHVERASAVVSALEARGFSVLRKTTLQSTHQSAPEDSIIVLDTIGELSICYSLATIAFVGRSLAPPGGGQNMMEPAALGKPVLVGPLTGNFRPEMELLEKSQAVVTVRGRAELARQADRLLDHPEQVRRLGEAARGVILRSQGATECVLEHVGRLLDN
ncbi:MAG: hypothetical protein J7M08_08850 [Planctomycetes bacterium]|nr:hypothetical protein [Planctomycetota bacterium]